MSLPAAHKSRVFVFCLILGAALGCSRQKEGERCSLTNGDSDCEDDLLCTEYQTLRDGEEDQVDRCCPDPDETPTDARCARRTASGGNTGGGSNSGQGGEGGGDGDGDEVLGNDGANCDYNSDCTPPLICGPGGHCQRECIEPIDCEDGETCTAEGACE